MNLGANIKGRPRITQEYHCWVVTVNINTTEERRKGVFGIRKGKLLRSHIVKGDSHSSAIERLDKAGENPTCSTQKGTQRI
eukprot:snap_masked-scaffold_20-processed-gene-5.53-mRNA-1 protein AED:1.00 eAED:1.00 QI:0/-1/0/0/-1/1/1/0/80